MATLHVLRPQNPPLAGFLRIGHTGHRKLAELHAAGRFPYRRIVVDAAHLHGQRDLLKTLKAGGCEIVLDPNFAEMAALGRFNSSSLQKLAWANVDRPWVPSDFASHRNDDLAKAMAAFAIEADFVSAVLAPTHLIESARDLWLPIDLGLCESLRYSLDAGGGSDIAIDYQLISTSAVLKDASSRALIENSIQNLPVENVWVRTSGFGATATGAGTRQFIESMRALHRIDKPLIADMVGGFAGLSALAFGAVAGISHGVGQKESFRASDWRKQSTGGGGANARAYLVELDRYFKEHQLEAIFSAKGARSRLGCNDSGCCPQGSEDMLANSHAHFLIQRHRQLDDLSNVPELRRIDHFLLRHLDPAISSARYAARLKIEDEKVFQAVLGGKTRMIRLRDALADLDSRGAPETRSRSPIFRGGFNNVRMRFGR